MYVSRVVIYERKMFIRLATELNITIVMGLEELATPEGCQSCSLLQLQVSQSLLRFE